jgi:tight adherence protein B
MSQMNPIIYIVAFVAVVMFVQALVSAVMNSGDRARRVNRRLTLLESGATQEKAYESLLRRPPTDALGVAAPGLHNHLSLRFRQAGLSITPLQFGIFLAAAAVALGAGAILLMTTFGQARNLTNVIVSFVGAAGLSITGGALIIAHLRNKRLKKLEEQLPEALDVVIRAVRAGHPLIMAIKLASEEMGDPIGSEFGFIVDETTYGLEFRDSLVNFAHRTGSEYVHFFAVSVAIQSETGGNLAEVLSNLATVIRNQQTLHLRVRALTSEGKMSAQVLSALPIILVSFIMFTQPNFYSSKFSEPIFWPVVFAIVTLYLIGQFIINRMVNFRY